MRFDGIGFLLGAHGVSYTGTATRHVSTQVNGTSVQLGNVYFEVLSHRICGAWGPKCDSPLIMAKYSRLFAST